MEKNLNHTIKLDMEDNREEERKILLDVFQALKEKGYDPVVQMAGYLISGDPAYITSHNNARNLIKKVERNKIIEELLTFYLEGREDL